MGRLRDSLGLPPSEQRHPVLMNAIYLWACFISRPEPLSQHEEHYLQYALDALPEALRSNDRIIDVIQASCLLSQYFLANGRLLEGSYHASAAASLSVQTGLGGRPYLNTPGWCSDSMDSDMKPASSDLRDGERILAFWQVYNLDRCWSVVLRKPCVIPDKSDNCHSVRCPWPQEIKDYENVKGIFLCLILITETGLKGTHRHGFVIADHPLIPLRVGFGQQLFDASYSSKGFCPVFPC